MSRYRPIFEHSDREGEQGELYLLHFERPFKHARHYLGWSRDAIKRIKDHRAGKGSNLMRLVAEAEIMFAVAWIRPGTMLDERKLKNSGGGSRHCTICHPHLKNKD